MHFVLGIWTRNCRMKDCVCRRIQLAMAPPHTFNCFCLLPVSYSPCILRIMVSSWTSLARSETVPKNFNVFQFHYKPNFLQISPPKMTCIGGCPGLVVRGGDSCSDGRGFKSWCRILDGHNIFSHSVVRIVMFFWKDENKRKRGQGWTIFLKKMTCIGDSYCSFAQGY